MFESLRNKTALISAGVSDIGRIMADAFLAQQARVHVADVSQRNQVDALFETLSGRLDVLVDNAGFAGPTAAFEDTDIDDWNVTLAVYLASDPGAVISAEAVGVDGYTASLADWLD